MSWPCCGFWLLSSLLGLAVIRLGSLGFRESGIPVGFGWSWKGVWAKLFGVVLILFGLLLLYPWSILMIIWILDPL